MDPCKQYAFYWLWTVELDSTLEEGYPTYLVKWALDL